ncbi:hypothetical protein BDQ17DRAFT_1435821 [Cyathus striatus]|nr:hypothetical protein BDQ17DRAFT_1435821 [Cyathus striatus]
MLPSFVRNAVRDVTRYTGEGSIFIPKGDIVMADILSLHHNPELHISPEAMNSIRMFIILCLHLYDTQLAPSWLAVSPEIDDILGFSTLVRAKTDLIISVQTRKFL